MSAVHSTLRAHLAGRGAPGASPPSWDAARTLAHLWAVYAREGDVVQRGMISTWQEELAQATGGRRHDLLCQHAEQLVELLGAQWGFAWGSWVAPHPMRCLECDGAITPGSIVLSHPRTFVVVHHACLPAGAEVAFDRTCTADPLAWLTRVLARDFHQHQ